MVSSGFKESSGDLDKMKIKNFKSNNIIPFLDNPEEEKDKELHSQYHSLFTEVVPSKKMPLEDDEGTFDHELAHALYYLNEDFKFEMLEILNDYNKNHHQEFLWLQDTLFDDFEYDYNVLYDETVAWLATSNKRTIVCDLKCDWISVEPYVKRFKKVLRKYNNFEI